jgi:hypothetical protein
LYPIANITATSVNSKVYRKAPQDNFNAGLYQGAFRILFYVLAVSLNRHPSYIEK